MHTWGSEWTEWPVYNLPIALMFLCRLFENKWWFYFFIFFSLSLTMLSDATEAISKQLGHSMGFSYEYKSLYFQMRFCWSAFLQNSKFKNSAKHCCIDNSVTTKFFFGLYFLFLLPRPPLLPLCRKNMKYLSGHRVLKAQLLHGNVAGIPDNGLQRWAKQPFFGTFFLCFQERCCIKMHLFLPTFAKRWIQALWVHSFTSNWFQFGLWAHKCEFASFGTCGEIFLFYLCLRGNLL